MDGVSNMDKNTKHLYAFEDAFFPKNHYLLKSRPLHELRKLAYRVWADYNTNPKYNTPWIRFGNGVYGLSYYDGNDNSIELCAGQRNIITLIHEMTHALNCGSHNKRFVQLYVELLLKYTPVKDYVLLGGLTFYNVKY